mmetsp:Transcript_9261/g.18869  ORF Transcript_9261/g.18869 Transcript_9261/m.18869 type:complete len:466 (+) Transcript_9261:288-1685(+)
MRAPSTNIHSRIRSEMKLGAAEKQRVVGMVGRYRLEEVVLGRGGFSEVRLGTEVSSGREVAIKMVRRVDLSPAREARLRKEVRIVRGIRHPGVVKIIEVMVSTRHFYLVMERIKGVELFDVIVSQSGLPENKARGYFQQLVDILCDLHRHGVCHRDIKPENILVDELGTVRLTDFGEADRCDGTRSLSECVGTMEYVAPEVLAADREHPYCGRIADAWSCGVLLYAMFTGNVPWLFEEPDLVAQEIHMRKIPFPPSIPKSATDLIDKLLEVDPRKRLSLEECRFHPWFVVDYNGEVRARSFSRSPRWPFVGERRRSTQVHADSSDQRRSSSVNHEDRPHRRILSGDYRRSSLATQEERTGRWNVSGENRRSSLLNDQLHHRWSAADGRRRSSLINNEGDFMNNQSRRSVPSQRHNRKSGFLHFDDLPFRRLSLVRNGESTDQSRPDGQRSSRPWSFRRREVKSAA